MGEKRARSCRTRKEMADAQEIREMKRRLELLEAVHADGPSANEKVQQCLRLHEQAEEEIKQLRGSW